MSLRKYQINERFFEFIDSPEKAYILGFIFADGCLNKKYYQIKIKLQEKDKEILEKIKQKMNYTRPLIIEKLNKNINIRGKTCFAQNSFSLLISSKSMYLDLLTHNLTSNKSFTCSFPQIASTFDSSFIRGYFDGDGSISIIKQNKKPHGEIGISGSTKICQDLQNKLKLLNIKSYINHDKTVKTGVDKLRIRDIKSVLRFKDFIYNESTIHLERKYQKFQNLSNQRGDVCLL